MKPPDGHWHRRGKVVARTPKNEPIYDCTHPGCEWRSKP